MNSHTLVLLSAVAVTCLFPVLSFAHDRGLDRYGCHHHRKHGGYHCHRGAMVGQSFKLQQEMLAAMKGKEKAPSSNNSGQSAKYVHRSSQTSQNSFTIWAPSSAATRPKRIRA